ncbi:TetR/AcrR family transcriptional regulator [Paenibacillus sedimenti]|uniref:TetR/AcrR family transcriptional regulator n=1 Tax=Paenibacillus sedimenti TaxID=2770274 RepID=A0A926KVP6_9BACL|nr:TetR/AcrR family transcriptional regulator [Paenibacillus sedimenti]MBD0384930.1 TetR/AcrR family transcriptional regulator [Paenibacillus sedimenti]
MSQGKEKILQTALQEFSEKGYDGARIDYISKMAGVNKALIYYHFKSKEELFTAVINDLFEKAVSVSIETKGTTIRENLIQVMEHFIDFLHNNPYFVKIMDQSVAQDRDIFQQLHHQNLFFEKVMGMYLLGVQTGECRNVDHPEDFVVSLLGAVYFYFSHHKAIRKFYGNISEEEVISIRKKTMKDMISRLVFL